MSWFKTTLAAVLFFSATSFAQAPKKEWTFLIFLNGHNNLSSFGEMNIKDMETIGSTQDLNIIVEWGTSTSKITKRLYVEKSTDPNKVTSKVVKQMTNYDMGNYKNLQSFVRWGVQNYPAHHYFIAVWNHGSGWRKSIATPSSRDISFDDNTGNKITTEQLGIAMADAKAAIGRNVDIYGSDACLMQMVEVAGEMKDSVDYFVGSQENIPAEGWPYKPFLSKWAATPTMTPREVAILLSKEYLAGYSNDGVYGYKDGITFSAWDMTKLSSAYTAIGNLATNLNSLKASDLALVKKSVPKALSFSLGDYVDLGDFTQQVKGLKLASVKMDLLTDVQQKIDDLVLTTDNGKGFEAATGLSIWLPTSANKHQARYDKLQFSRATGWNNITKKLVK
jgi:Clostripain family